MAIALACPECASSVPVTHDMAGKRASCPQCRKELALPRTLVELPDRDGDHVERPAARERVSILPWVLGLGTVVVVLLVLCGGPMAVLFYLLRSDSAAAELAARAVVQPSGANLPAGAPPRAMRVTEFQGVFQVRSQLVQGDVVYKHVGAAPTTKTRYARSMSSIWKQDAATLSTSNARPILTLICG